MTRKARPKQQQRFDLYTDNDDERELHNYLAKLALIGKQREFIAFALIVAMKKRKNDR